MKFAIISDIHGNLEALNAVLAKAEQEGVQKYICAGDVVGYNANPHECLEQIRSLNLVAMVRGNHDEYVGSDTELVGFNPYAKRAVMWAKKQLNDEEREWLAAQKLKKVLLKDKITIVHATLDSPSMWGYIFDVHHAKDNFSYQMTQLCFCGHSHVPIMFRKGISIVNSKGNVEEVKPWADISQSEITIPIKTDCKYLVNIGSVGQPRNSDPRASFVIYDSDKKQLTRCAVEYDIATAQGKVLRAGLPDNLAKRLALGY